MCSTYEQHFEQSSKTRVTLADSVLPSGLFQSQSLSKLVKWKYYPPQTRNQTLKQSPFFCFVNCDSVTCSPNILDFLNNFSLSNFEILSWHVMIQPDLYCTMGQVLQSGPVGLKLFLKYGPRHSVYKCNYLKRQTFTFATSQVLFSILFLLIIKFTDFDSYLF